MRSHRMKSDLMDTEPGSPTRENLSRVLQISARTLWMVWTLPLLVRYRAEM